MRFTRTPAKHAERMRRYRAKLRSAKATKPEIEPQKRGNASTFSSPFSASGVITCPEGMHLRGRAVLCPHCDGCFATKKAAMTHIGIVNATPQADLPKAWQMTEQGKSVPPHKHSDHAGRCVTCGAERG